MCFCNCIHEDWNGECRLGKYPEGWICPPSRAECIRCGEIYEFDGLPDHLCNDCRAEEEKQIEKNKRTCSVCNQPFDMNDSESEDFCQDCLEKIDADEIIWRGEFEQYLSDEDYQEILAEEEKEAEERNRKWIRSLEKAKKKFLEEEKE